jgi:abhydrolase domain-containing protein 12
LSDGSTSKIHILAPDYRGFGYSTGFPTEQGIITDAIATVEWALKVANIPPERIVILGQSLGTAVSTATAEYFAKQGIEFAGVVLVAGFTDLPTLLTSYSIGGWVPILSPLRHSPAIQKWFASYVADTWMSAKRLANFVRISKKVRLFIIHAKDDYEIPWVHSEGLFAVAANATSEGMPLKQLESMKARGTTSMGDGAFISTWNAGGDKIIREEIVAYGRKFT